MKIKRIYLYLLLIIIPFILCGCWNYREIEQMSIVAGIAVDKGQTKGQYDVTIELVDIEGGQEFKPKSKVITVSGETMFDAARNAISMIGNKLYWSHAKVIIISPDIARAGINKIMDWYVRDAETRPDVYIMVSKTARAKDIYLNSRNSTEVLSFQFADILENEKNLSKAPNNELWEIVNSLEGEGINSVLPVISLLESNNESIPIIEGAAIFKKADLIGFLDPLDTKYMLSVKDELKGGVILVETVTESNKESNIALEIINSKTTITPILHGNNIAIQISVKSSVAIDEVNGEYDIADPERRVILESIAEDKLKTYMQKVIKKVQEDFGIDIFGFGNKIYQDMPGKWNEIKDEWDTLFPYIRVNITCDVTIKGSALISEPIKTKP